MLSNDVWTIIGVNVGLFAAAFTLILWSLNKVDNDIKSLVTRIDGQAARIDQLYTMFVDLLKTKKDS